MTVLMTEFPDNLYGVQRPKNFSLESFLDYKHEIELKIIEKELKFKERRRMFNEMLDEEECSLKLRASTNLASLEKFKYQIEIAAKTRHDFC